MVESRDLATFCYGCAEEALGVGRGSLRAPNTCAWSHSPMSFPKETLKLCKQGTTTQSPAEHLALPDPPGLSPSGSQPPTRRGRGGCCLLRAPG